ncbi:hypothetical protein SEVIR_3G258150v4 [Setaria viridis]
MRQLRRGVGHRSHQVSCSVVDSTRRGTRDRGPGISAAHMGGPTAGRQGGRAPHGGSGRSRPRSASAAGPAACSCRRRTDNHRLLRAQKGARVTSSRAVSKAAAGGGGSSSN